jgi:phosphoglycolate phosphatase
MFSVYGPAWEIRGLEAVIFDKDGTIVDLHPYWGEIIRRRANAVVAHYKLPPEWFAHLCASMGLSLETNRLLPQGPVGLASRDEVVEAVRSCLSRSGIPVSTETITSLFVQVHEAFLPDLERYLELIPGTADFFASLQRAGAQMAIVTSDTVVNTRQILKHLGIGAYFEVIIGRDTTPEPKTSGVPALKAIKALGCRSEATVCVGDAPMDLLMANASGCQAGIGVATGQVPADELRRYTPYVTLSLQELKSLKR